MPLAVKLAPLFEIALPPVTKLVSPTLDAVVVVSVGTEGPPPPPDGVVNATSAPVPTPELFCAYAWTI